MTTVADVTGWLEQFAPRRLAESWDNVGLLLGDPQAPVSRVMTCLTVTRKTAEEAVAASAELIVSHHPILFRAAKQIRLDLAETAPVWILARSGIAVTSPHTSFDSTMGGINDGLCRRLGLSDVTPLRSLPEPAPCKIVVFTPDSDREAMLAAAFEAGAGNIGEYRECSFAIPGQGTFFGSERSNPSRGERGRREVVDELRLELICPADRLTSVLGAIRSHHTYEEPAIDVYPLQALAGARNAGSGRIGTLTTACSLDSFAAVVSKALGLPAVQVTGNPDREVRRVAVACGAGDDFLSDAARAQADVLVTGEARYHRAVEAESLGIGLMVAGHHATERPGVEELSDRIAKAFPQLTVWPSQNENDPVRLVFARTSTPVE